VSSAFDVISLAECIFSSAVRAPTPATYILSPALFETRLKLMQSTRFLICKYFLISGFGWHGGKSSIGEAEFSSKNRGLT
jgi:hypothetical protein